MLLVCNKHNYRVTAFQLEMLPLFFVVYITDKIAFHLENSVKIYYNKINGCALFCKGVVRNESELPPQNGKGLCEGEL